MIDDFWTRYEPNRLQLHTFVQLKVLFSGLIEMMILLDRLVFLQESVCSLRSFSFASTRLLSLYSQVPSASSYLVALFDPVKSPRRWCLVSLKAT